MKTFTYALITLFSKLLLAEDYLLDEKVEAIKRLSHESAREELATLLKTGHKAITYREAQTYLFTLIDTDNGRVCGIYSPNECITTYEIPDHKIMNVEHSWPQSDGANGIAKSDLHHLFVATNATNSMRSSLPFCDVVQVYWTNKWSKRGASRFKDHCFEPPQNYKGDIARAFFYFSLRYNMSIDKNEEFFLRKWHREDPVNEEERLREEKISNIQRNRNLFVIYPELVDLI